MSETPNRASDAFSEGVDAKLEGKDIDSCDYPEGSKEREDFEDGYTMTKMAGGGIEGLFTV